MYAIGPDSREKEPLSEMPDITYEVINSKPTPAENQRKSANRRNQGNYRQRQAGMIKNIHENVQRLQENAIDLQGLKHQPEALYNVFKNVLEQTLVETLPQTLEQTLQQTIEQTVEQTVEQTIEQTIEQRFQQFEQTLQQTIERVLQMPNGMPQSDHLKHTGSAASISPIARGSFGKIGKASYGCVKPPRGGMPPVLPNTQALLPNGSLTAPNAVSAPTICPKYGVPSHGSYPITPASPPTSVRSRESFPF